MTPPSRTAAAVSDPFSATRLVLTSPQALIAGLPYLLGFPPQESTVFVWMSEGRIVLTQRIDAGAFDAGPDVWSTAVWGHQGAQEADEVVLIHVSDAAPPASLIDTFAVEAQTRGVAVKDLLSVVAGRWRSVMCTDPMCCPPDGRTIEEQVVSAVAAEFTVLGVAPRADRHALVEELAALPEVSSPERLARVRAARPRRRRDIERWRDRAIARAAEIELPLSPADRDFITAGLADIRVRDTVLWECARSTTERLSLLMSAMQSCARCAPPGFVAPVATCVAVIAWIQGDGARAGIALERALADRPDYSLALLVRHAIGTGMPPSTWRAAMDSVTRQECRRGRH